MREAHGKRPRARKTASLQSARSTPHTLTRLHERHDLPLARACRGMRAHAVIVCVCVRALDARARAAIHECVPARAAGGAAAASRGRGRRKRGAAGAGQGAPAQARGVPAVVCESHAGSAGGHDARILMLQLLRLLLLLLLPLLAVVAKEPTLFAAARAAAGEGRRTCAGPARVRRAAHAGAGGQGPHCGVRGAHRARHDGQDFCNSEAVSPAAHARTRAPASRHVRETYPSPTAPRRHEQAETEWSHAKALAEEEKRGAIDAAERRHQQEVRRRGTLVARASIV